MKAESRPTLCTCHLKARTASTDTPRSPSRAGRYPQAATGAARGADTSDSAEGRVTGGMVGEASGTQTARARADLF